MKRLKEQRNKYFHRDIHRSGHYIPHFRPDDIDNPFQKLYAQKRSESLKILTEFQNDKTILDIGGGMGRIAVSVARSEKKHTVLADISMNMLKLAKKSVPDQENLILVNVDAHHLPFKDNVFGRIIGLDLFCHLMYPEEVLRELYRILIKGGIVVLDSTSSNPFWTLFFPRYLGLNPMRWIKIWTNKGILPGWEKVVNHYSKKEYTSFLRSAGFEIVRLIHYGPRLCPKWHMAVLLKST